LNVFLENVTVCRTLPPRKENAMNIPLSTPESRLPLTPSAPTATAAIAMLQAATDLKDGPKKKLITAINCAVEALRPGEDPNLAGRHVLMNCATINPLLDRTAAQLGKSEERFTSLCSEWRRVLRYFGQHDSDRRGQALVSPALQAALDALPAPRRHALVDFMRAIDAAGKELHDANQEFFEHYLARQATHRLHRNRHKRPGQIVASWKWARGHRQGWPDFDLTAPKRAARADPPDYTPSFLADLDKYCSPFDDNTNNLLDQIFLKKPDEPTRRLSKRSDATLRNKRWLLQAAAGALVQQGVDPQNLRLLQDLVQPAERPQAAITYYLKKFSGTESTMAFKIAEELRLLARDYCRLTEVADEMAVWVKNIRNITPQQMSMTPKNRQRLRALMQILPRGMLLNLPHELVQRTKRIELSNARKNGGDGQSKRVPTRDGALLMMDAVALEILLICPLRRKNLVGLRLDVHLQRPDPRSSQLTRIYLPPGEVKNKEEIDWPISPESAKLIETFIKNYRPLIAEEGNPFLFPGDKGSRNPMGMASRISKLVTREIGVEFNLHLARHFAAWNFLRRYPGQYEIVRQILGHKDIETTRRYYLGLEKDANVRRFDSVMLEDRQATRRIAMQAFRKGRGGLGPYGRRR
jgi:integrase